MQLLLRCFLSSAWKLPLYFLHTATNKSESLPEAVLCQCQDKDRIKVPIQSSPASRTLKLNTFKRTASFIWSSRALVKPSFSGEKERVVKNLIAVVIRYCLASTDGLRDDLETDTPH